MDVLCACLERAILRRIPQQLPILLCNGQSFCVPFTRHRFHDDRIIECSFLSCVLPFIVASLRGLLKASSLEM